MKEFLRFFSVTVFGVVLDIAIAYALAEGLGVRLWVAALTGFVVAASFNYVAHQLWSFQSGPQRLAADRAVKYAGVAITTLATRLLVVAGLEFAVGSDPALVILVCGAGVSFCVNFTLSKAYVFAKAPAEVDPR